MSIRKKKTRKKRTKSNRRNKTGGVTQEDANEMLFEAVEHDNIEEVNHAIEEGADIDTLNRYDYTPLMTAVSSKKSIELIELLLLRGADVNASDDPNGYTSLILASKNMNALVVRLLLYHGADITMRTTSGMNALSMLLAWSPRGMIDDIRGKRELIIRSFNQYITDEIRYEFFNCRDEDMNTPLMYIALPPHLAIPIIINGIHTIEASSIIMTLIEFGADKSLQNNSGQTAYDIARNGPLNLARNRQLNDEYLLNLLRPDGQLDDNPTAPIPIMSEEMYNNCAKDDEDTIYDAISQDKLLREHAVKLNDNTNYCYDRNNLLQWIKTTINNPTNPMTRENIDREWIRREYPRGINYDYSNVTLNGGKRKKKRQTKRRKHKRKQKKTKRRK